MDLIIDRETIALWPQEAPYTAESPDQRQPSLMPYPIAGAKGAVVVVPGGGYCMKADHEGRAIAEMINEAGVAAYVLDYRVRPCHYLAPLSDAKRAIRLVRSLGYEKVAILGFPPADTCAAPPRRSTTGATPTRRIPSSGCRPGRTPSSPATRW